MLDEGARVGLMHRVVIEKESNSYERGAKYNKVSI